MPTPWRAYCGGPSSRPAGEPQTNPSPRNLGAVFRHLLCGSDFQGAGAGQEPACLYVSDSQVQPEIKVAVLGRIRLKLSPGSRRNGPEGLVEGGAKHLYAVFHRGGNQSGKLVQTLPLNRPCNRYVPDKASGHAKEM